MRPDLRPPAVALLTAASLLVPSTAYADSAGSAANARASGPTRLAVAGFPRPLDTTSRYFPLTPNQRLVYEGTVKDADGIHRHRVVFTVTDLVKWVDGMNTRVILDEDYADGVLAEAELAFFAQDAAANVWSRGEYPEEYDHGRFVGAPRAWTGGLRGARSGVLVPGRPRTGAPPFTQGRAPAVGFDDVGQVVATGLRLCVPTGCYSDVVKIKEWAPNAPQDGYQLKYYAPHVGLVQVAALSGDSQETLRLVSLIRLTPGATVRVRQAALRLDRRARRLAAGRTAISAAHRQR
jgi:hypothetical protein